MRLTLGPIAQLVRAEDSNPLVMGLILLGPPYIESGLFIAMANFFYAVLRDLRISWYMANHIEYWYICWYSYTNAEIYQHAINSYYYQETNPKRKCTQAALTSIVMVTVYSYGLELPTIGFCSCMI